jgi:hypothetical protein
MLVTPTGTGLVVQCIFFDGLVKTTEADEYVQILNEGSSIVDLSRMAADRPGRRLTRVHFSFLSIVTAAVDTAVYERGPSGVGRVFLPT